MTSPGDKISDTQCKTGYVKVDGTCEEACALDPCQELIQIRQNTTNLYELFCYYSFTTDPRPLNSRSLIKYASIMIRDV